MSGARLKTGTATEVGWVSKNAAIEFVKENESGMFTLKRKIGEFGTCFKG